MIAAEQASWIAVDWGTTNLRVWVLDDNDVPLVHRVSNKGMGTLEPHEFETTLLDIVGDYLNEERATPVIVCGMAGSRQGWREAPYMTVPCAPPGISEATDVKASDPRIDVCMLPGIKQLDPADVMRGEETQIAGFLAKRPGYTGVLCLPGTHTKWTFLEEGMITRFQTAMTGETFALLSEHSVLRHSVSTAEVDKSAFSEAVLLMIEQPESLTRELFGIRAADLVGASPPNEARGRLSGLLVGAELAAMKPLIGKDKVALLGSDAVSKAYAAGLSICGCQLEVLDAEALTLKGLTLAYQNHLKDKS